MKGNNQGDIRYTVYEVPAIATPDEVRSIRSMLGQSQAEFAATMCVTEFTVWRWENGKRQMDTEQTRQLRAIGDRDIFSQYQD